MTKIYGQITGWGSYVPEKVLTNFDLEKIVDTTNDWIVQRSGIHERRIAAPEETTSMMSTNAAEKALAQAGVLPTDLDLIIVANSSPDYFTPPVSSQVQHALGATNVPAFVVETGCTGFVYALSTAYQFIIAGAYQTILVVGVELLSRFTNWEDRSTCVLFGDAAGAVVVQATDKVCGLQGFVLGSDGSQAEHIIMRAGGSAEPYNEDTLANNRHLLHMDGRQVFRFASRVVGKACDEALEKAGLTYDDIDWIIPHQANLRIIQSAARDMGLPMSRFIVNIDRYGNTSAASIPLALAENLESGRIQPGDTGIFVSFGAGLTWGAMVVQLNPN